VSSQNAVRVSARYFAKNETVRRTSGALSHSLSCTLNQRRDTWPPSKRALSPLLGAEGADDLVENGLLVSPVAVLRDQRQDIYLVIGNQAHDLGKYLRIHAHRT